MSVRVTVVDEQTGETEVQRVPDGDYLLIAVEPCQLTAAQRMGAAGQTHQLTIRHRNPQPLPDVVRPAPASLPRLLEESVVRVGGRADGPLDVDAMAARILDAGVCEHLIPRAECRLASHPLAP